MEPVVRDAMSVRTARLWLLGLFLAHAGVHLAGFQSVYLDSDQLVMADQASWIARGEFHEPFFFGQAYLLPFESYLSVPLIWLGVWPIAAVKAVAAASLYLPFVWAAWVLAQERPWAALGVALLFIGLHPEYMLTAALPRGFIAATALAWAGLWVLLRHPGLAGSAIVAIAVGVGFCTGSYMSIALMLPVLIWLPSRRHMVLVGVGLLIGFMLFKALGLFYKFNPSYIVHLLPRIGFKLGYLVHNSAVPAIHAAVLQLTALTGCVCAVALWPGARRWHRRDAVRWLICLAAVAMAIALMVANNKIVEFNSKSPFFSVYRMMLPLPFLGLLLLGRRVTEDLPLPGKGNAESGWMRHGVKGLALLSVVAVIQMHRLNHVGPHFASLPSTVPPITFEWLRENCEEIGGWWRDSKAPYFVLEGRNDALAYGCHAQYGVPVRQTVHERRTWLKERFAQGVPQ
jgi:hypothetical protein